MIFDYLPRVFRKSVLPVRTERRKRQQRREHDRADRGYGCLVEPLLHPDLDAGAAGLRGHLDRQRRRETGQIAQGVRLSRLHDAGGRNLECLYLIFAVEEVPQLHG